MTWGASAHLYLKRAKADQIAFGTPGAHRARLVDLPTRWENFEFKPATMAM